MPISPIHRRTPLILMTMAALWLASHPWRGIWHDSVLYTVQALRRLYPANFQHDLYFLHGSQDAFTLFSPLYASAIAAFGLPAAALLLLAAGHALWIAATAWLLSAFLRGVYFWLGLAMLFAWPSDYGPLPSVFRLAEPFLTPRLFAEGLGILALACFVRGRWGWGVWPAVLAFGLHPLVAAAPLLAGLLLRTWGNWRALAALAAIGVAVLAAGLAAGIPPFDRFLASMDGEWLALVVRRAPMVSWTAWQAQDWVSRTAVAFCLVATAGYLAQGNAGRLFRCAAAVGGIGLLASWIGTGLHSNLLLIQAQPWRMLWVTQLCSWPALAWLFAEYWQRDRTLRMLLLALCLAALTRHSVGGAVALLAGAALCHLAHRPATRWPAWGNPAALAVLAGLCAIWLLDVTRLAAAEAPLLPAQETGWWFILWCLSALDLGAGAAAGTAILLVAWHWSGSPDRRRHLAAFAIALVCLCSAAMFAGFDATRPHELSRAGKRAVQAAFLPWIPPTATLYWQNNALVSWFDLRRSNYAANIQLAGLAFNRGTAIEGARRMRRIMGLGGEDGLLAPNNRLTRINARSLLPRPSRAALEHACADPLLDFVVLATPLGSDAIAQASDSEYGKTYYLYACARLRGH